MTKNTLSDLSNHLFEQMERLNNDDLTDDELKKEIGRSKAMTEISQQIIDDSRLMYDVVRFKSSVRFDGTPIPRQLGGGDASQDS